MRRFLALVAVFGMLSSGSVAVADSREVFSSSSERLQLGFPMGVLAVPRVSRSTDPTVNTRAGVTKVLVIVEENHSVKQTREGMPYLQSLGQRYGEALNYRAIRSQSEPNYLVMAGGSTFGVADDRSPSAHPIRGESVFGQAAARQLASGTYSESMPSGTCILTGDYYRGYAVNHNPQAFFVDERSQCRLSNRSGFTFSADAAASRLPTVGFLIPNQCHNAHDCSLRVADRYLEKFLPAVLASEDFTSGRLAVVITADEDDDHGPNFVYTSVLQADVHRTSRVPLTHYSLSRLLSEVSGSKPLREAAEAPDLAAAFGFRIARRP